MVDSQCTRAEKMYDKPIKTVTLQHLQNMLQTLAIEELIKYYITSQIWKVAVTGA